MESVKWLTLLLQSDPTPPPTRKLMEKSGQTETPSYTWCCIWIMGTGRGGVTLLHCIVIVMNNKHSGAQVKGSAAALLGFFVAFSLGRRVKWPSIWLGGAGGDIFLIMDPNSTECISTWLRSDNDANHGTSRRLSCTDAYFLLYLPINM